MLRYWRIRRRGSVNQRRTHILILAALGTIRAETEGFVPISEYPQFNTLPGLPAFSAYDAGTDKGAKNLGNIKPVDGARFRDVVSYSLRGGRTTRNMLPA